MGGKKGAIAAHEPPLRVFDEEIDVGDVVEQDLETSRARHARQETPSEYLLVGESGVGRHGASDASCQGGLLPRPKQLQEARDTVTKSEQISQKIDPD